MMHYLPTVMLALLVADVTAIQKVRLNFKKADGNVVTDLQSVIVFNQDAQSSFPVSINGNSLNVQFDLADDTNYRITYSTLTATGTILLKTEPENRRRSNIEMVLAALVPTLTSDQEFQLIALWSNDGSNSRCNFESVLEKQACAVDGHYNPFCMDPSYNYVYHLGDSACPDQTGAEVIDIYEAGAGSYKHMFYANLASGSFVGSQAQVHVYRRNPVTGITEAFVSAVVTTAASYNSAHRFYHTVSFDVNGMTATASSTATNQVTCDPYLTLGTTATQSFETYGRNC